MRTEVSIKFSKYEDLHKMIGNGLECWRSRLSVGYWSMRFVAVWLNYFKYLGDLNDVRRFLYLIPVVAGSSMSPSTASKICRPYDSLRAVESEHLRGLRIWRERCLAGPAPSDFPKTNLRECLKVGNGQKAALNPNFALDLQAHKVIFRVSNPLSIAQKPLDSRGQHIGQYLGGIK